MKANAPRRKVFCDAVDLLTGAETAVPGSGVQMLPVDSIRPFHGHPFHLYEGRKLEEMTEIIREHGILCPVIVRTAESGYEMLAGHNRQNAARLAGLTEIPAIVKENLPDDEAYVYVIETNVIQRSFNDLSVSEKIAVVAERYDKVMSQGKRNDIIRELEQMNEDATCGHDVHKSGRSREAIGQECGMTGRNAARYIRCSQLIPEFKGMLDDGSLPMAAAVELSYLPEEEQAAVKEAADQHGTRIKADKAAELRKASGSLSKAEAQRILAAGRPVRKDAEKTVSVKLPAKVYERYFSGTAEKDVLSILEEALELFFEKKGV